MPRANRYYHPGHVWHITHRCIERQFLLKFARDRRRYLHWLFEAKKRFGLCVLNYIVTSNHVHLLVKDTGRGEIARSMRLAAARRHWVRLDKLTNYNGRSEGRRRVKHGGRSDGARSQFRLGRFGREC